MRSGQGHAQGQMSVGAVLTLELWPGLPLLAQYSHRGPVRLVMEESPIPLLPLK